MFSGTDYACALAITCIVMAPVYVAGFFIIKLVKSNILQVLSVCALTTKMVTMEMNVPQNVKVPRDKMRTVVRNHLQRLEEDSETLPELSKSFPNLSDIELEALYNELETRYAIDNNRALIATIITTSAKYFISEAAVNDISVKLNSDTTLDVLAATLTTQTLNPLGQMLMRYLPIMFTSHKKR